MKPSPYPLVHFEANLLRNIDCGRLSFSVTCLRPLFDFFFFSLFHQKLLSKFRIRCLEKHLLNEGQQKEKMKNTFLTKDNKK